MSPTFERLRLLIVDDDEQLCETLARRFRRLGAAVTTAPSGDEALAIIKSTEVMIAREASNPKP